MEPRPRPPANDAPLEVLVATEPHEEPSLGLVGRFLLRHRQASIALLAIASGLLFLFAWTLANGEEIHGKVISVADGDTLTILTSEKRSLRVRLAGIDAPEYGQPYGNRSWASLAELCARKEARVTAAGKDRYSRTLGRVHCAGVDANAEQVRRGMAWVFDRYATDATLYAEQDAARAARRGLWAWSKPIAPWDWREAKRQQRVLPH